MNGYDVLFFTNNLLIGTGLAMDAFSVSLANGLNEPKMKKRRAILISGVFSVFQALMPLIGWFCVSTLRHYFTVFEKFIPYIALILLAFIGGKMLLEGIKKKTSEEAEENLKLAEQKLNLTIIEKIPELYKTVDKNLKTILKN